MMVNITQTDYWQEACSLDVGAGIHLIGLGVNEFWDIPVAALVVLQKCQRVFLLCDGRQTEDHIRNINGKVECLNYLYESGHYLESIHCSIMRAVMDNYNGGAAALAMNGNVLFLNNISQQIERECDARGVPVYSYNSTSSLDGILHLSRLNINQAGLQVYTEGFLVKNPQVLDGSIPVAIFQMGTESDGRMIVSSGEATENYSELCRVLFAAYGPKAKFSFYQLANSRDGRNISVVGLVSELKQLSPVNKSGTLLARIFHKKGRLSFNPLIKWLFRQERFGRS
ncbi:SAM-dependent methyltransferase [Thiocapsa bogorovii]|uniref:hypothetical protein n=1 Tax=Thiocapsa bogorovii TaxID=521689 RepID=UPI001E498F69|nr:hypothetical protein [Thiocapsa bogorovii]UHD15276.1 hypothetical protein LT988_18665 [Thiocapsa bogorovii]